MALIASGIAATTIAMTIAPAFGASVRDSEWWLSALGVSRAQAATKGSGVTVAVLSDGVDASQADLTGSVTAAPNQVSGAPDSGQFFGQLGTGLASLIAGHGHGAGDAAGIIGVAPQAKILSVPVTLPSTDPLLTQTSVAAALPGDIAAGIRYAVAHGASVIDLPIDPAQPNASGSSGASAASGGSSAERAAVTYALAHNVVLVAPAGDNGSGSDAANFPAAYTGVISVGAFDRAFAKAPWTSHQRYVTITAAGVSVRAAANDGGYQTLNSTSAASAIVAGMAALIRSRYPSLDVAQVRQALISGTKFHGSTAGSGNGTANAQLALAAAATEVPAGSPAGTGAQPLVTQAAPAAAPQTLPSTLMRDGIISAALLGLLLLLIALYSALRRRRLVRKQAAIAAEWTGRQPQSRYPHAGTEGDRMLEYFAAPTQSPGTGAARPGGRAARTPAISAQRPLAIANRQPVASQAISGQAIVGQPISGQPAGSQVSGRLVRSRITGAPPGPSPWDEADTEVGLRPALASREVNRRPPVVGSPPWGPAVQPDSDLPWAAAATQDLAAGTPAPSGQASYEGPVPITGQAVALPTRGPSGPPRDEVGPGSGLGRLAIAAGRSGNAIAAARAGVAAAAQESQARQVSAQPDAAAPPSGPPGPTGGSGSLWERSQPGQSPSVESPAELTWPGQPVSNGLAGPSMSGGLDWRNDLAASSSGDQASPVSGFASPSAHGPGFPAQPEYAPQQPDGPLPVRQPRRSTPEAPLSPSGSLWERAIDSGEEPAPSQGSGSRPIYVWDPGTPTESYSTMPRGSGGHSVPEPADRGSQSADWDNRSPDWDNRSPDWDNRSPDWGNRSPDWDSRSPDWGNQSPDWEIQPPRAILPPPESLPQDNWPPDDWPQGSSPQDSSPQDSWQRRDSRPQDSSPQDSWQRRDSRPPWDTQPPPWGSQSR